MSCSTARSRTPSSASREYTAPWGFDRRVDDEQFRLVGDGVSEVVERGFKLEVVGGSVDTGQRPAGEFRHRFVGHPGRVEQGDFVAVVDDGLERLEQRLFAARRDDDFVRTACSRRRGVCPR